MNDGPTLSTSHKVMNTHLLASNMDWARDQEDWEVPVSETRVWTYTLGSPLIATSQINLFGVGNVAAWRKRVMGYPMYERDAMMLAYEGEVLNWRAHWKQRDHVAVTERVTTWRSQILVIQGHALPVHPFESEQRFLASLNNPPYTPSDGPDDALTHKALTREYDSSSNTKQPLQHRSLRLSPSLSNPPSGLVLQADWDVHPRCQDVQQRSLGGAGDSNEDDHEENKLLYHRQSDTGTVFDVKEKEKILLCCVFSAVFSR
ncbi:hypothetical protein IW261DRAFT_1426082 [Armillaria novae-zelandiae]|uniref:Uncharacterized protein n=1 Tax=Armillaria novae-zelandiae TaxID=153914 RepID=A0AA39NNH5_9AGAR|nr:hypothetical protein IW261DRAFT_1426082 [Armillaria novae-zelandiae]